MTELICGLDEAGRGPLAGPVTAGCVILPADFPTGILGDSKKLSLRKREAAEKVIMERACWGIGIVDHEEIDRMNILRATMRAMQIAYDMMSARLPAWLAAQGIASDGGTELSGLISAIVDGTSCPQIPCRCRCEPKADSKYAEVMAASIIAKVERDKIMTEFDRLYPQYGYARHKGYPTAAHIKICREIGMSPIQRRTFKF